MDLLCLIQSIRTTRNRNNELLYLHKRLVEIQSISGYEESVGLFLKAYLEEQNFTVELQEVENKRYNVLAWPGETKNTSVLLTSHIDTVPPYIQYNRNSTHISGRGSVDAKASVAAQIIAARNILKNDTSASLSLLYVIAEETTGLGMRTFSSNNTHPYRAVIFGEPTESALVAGHKGNVWLTLRVKGRAAHSGYPWLGLSATEVLVEALGVIKSLEKMGAFPSSDKYRNTTVNIGHMTGGVAANVVAETAEADVAVRLAAGTPDDFINIVEGGLEETGKWVKEKGGELEVVWTNRGYPPIDCACDVKGFECITVNYGTDVPWLEGDHKRYLYGPGTIFVAHSDHEAIAVKELEKAVGDYEKLILAALEEKSAPWNFWEM
ncbi:Zn-dependent exopeptidase [Patellaria atrata CBS 101060]|uniref:Zn-dependent exopeptidase n=1 Tax=Patellaria atrata CBS 101060 TaxID=1346257 RepID=A0A9P4VWM6_9PEZI|nr:Zn-dependent exopeptidase [Patellaria atrata CBS 101060]